MKNKLIEKIKERIYCIMYFFTKKMGFNPNIPSIIETIDYIIENKVSVSRFGDGEFRWMLGLKQNSFQEDSDEMKKRLCEIVKSNENGHINCLPNIFNSLDEYNDSAKMFWKTNLGKFRFRYQRLLDKDIKYYNLNITRPYMDYLDKSNSETIFSSLKRIWENKNIVIIEGKYSRLGVGNDLFDNTLSIERIICPYKNAYNIYDKILSKTIDFVKDKNKLILISLGPTATILAYDLYKNGYQAIDIGHVDIEYMWFLNGANDKIPVQNKYVNEAADKNGTIVGECLDSKYLNEISIDLS